jgi:prepilin signal peptidase PulO-like enzyme (type II secretory pathway)
MEAASVQPATVSAPERTLRGLLPHGRVQTATYAVGAVLVAASFAEFGASGRALVGAIMCPALVLLAVIDARHRLLPNAIVFPTTLALGLALAATNPGGFLEHLEAALALGAFLLIFALIARSGLGMGDVKVGFLLGLALGSRTLSAMMIAFFGLFLAALWILVRNGLSARKQAIPFGPFLAVGAIAAFFLT